jgi:hypothetical protein
MSQPRTRRIDRGRSHTYLLDGERADGVTWILSQGVPKPALINWAARTTADYAVDHWEELSAQTASERVRTLEKARWADRDGAAVRGTQVHELAQKLASGVELDIPEPLVGHVDAYLQFAEQWQPEELVIESVVGNRRYRYMGTLDLIARLADDRTWLLDWKTAASGIWPESALQLAAYRNAEFYLDGNGQEQPMPTVDACGCVWLRADGYDLIPVDAGPDTFRSFLYAQQIAHFTDNPKEQYVLEAIQP